VGAEGDDLEWFPDQFPAPVAAESPGELR